MEQVIQIFGAMLILVAYILSQRKQLTPDSAPYLWLNFIGSVILGVLAGKGQQWGFLLLEVVWAIVTLNSLIRLYLRPASQKDSPPLVTKH